MHAWEAIQKTLDYIEKHLTEEITIEELAELAALSPFYYQRLFSRLVKKPVMEYLKLRRLAKGAELLKDRGKEGRVLDVALDCGFASHETFSRAFKEAYAMTPEQYREQPVILNQYDKPDLLLNYTMMDEGVPLVSDGLVLEMRRCQLMEPMLFLGICGYVPIEGQIPLGEGTGVDVPGLIWEKFHQVKEALPRLDGGKELGVAYFGDAPEGSFTYFTGAEVARGTDQEPMQRPEVWMDKLALAQSDMKACYFTLPTGSYMVCGFEAEDAMTLVTTAVNKAVKFSQLWLKEHGLTQVAYSPEVYYESPASGGAYMELWIPLGKAEQPDL